MAAVEVLTMTITVCLTFQLYIMHTPQGTKSKYCTKVANKHGHEITIHDTCLIPIFHTNLVRASNQVRETLDKFIKEILAA